MLKFRLIFIEFRNKMSLRVENKWWTGKYSQKALSYWDLGPGKKETMRTYNNQDHFKIATLNFKMVSGRDT